MLIDDSAASLVPSQDSDALSIGSAEPLGCVISVGGSQVMVQFSADRTSHGDGAANVTVGTFLGIRGSHSLVIGALCEISLDKPREGERDLGASGRIDLLGELVCDSAGAWHFSRGVLAYPKIGSPIVPIGNSELRIIFDVAGPNTINVGRLQQDGSISAYLDVDDMVSKHFAIFGSTGAGKSSGVALILRQIMQARGDLRMLLIDPHNEYGACFEDHALVLRYGTLRLPFWLFNFDEIVEVIFGQREDVEEEVSLFSELIPLAKSEFARSSVANRTSYRQVESEGGRFTVDTPVPYRMEDLIALAESRMGKLENRAIAIQYQRLLLHLNTVRKNPRYAFIFDDAGFAGDTMVDILCQLFRLETGGPTMTTLQLAGFPTEVFDAVVSVVFRLAFEFGLWSDGALPLLIVCEEAHNYANADRSIGFRPAREALSRIAKEGRKYGVILGLVTQRPSQLDPTLISQCSTVFAMRMANEDDQRIVRAAVSDPGNRLLGFLPSLSAREAVAFGAGVPVATRLRFSELPEPHIPRSEAVWGGRVDAGQNVSKNLVAAIVARWRGLATASKPVAAPVRPAPSPTAADAGFFTVDSASSRPGSGYR